MIFYFAFLFSFFTFAQNIQNESVEDRLTSAISTIDAERILDELFSQNPDLLERANAITLNSTLLFETEKLKSSSLHLIHILDPLTHLIRKLPVAGNSLALTIDIIMKGLFGSRYLLSKWDEASVRKRLSAFMIKSTDEIMLRALLEQYLKEIYQPEEALHDLTDRRKSFFKAKNTEDTTLFRKLKELSFTVLKNTLEDLGDYYFVTRFHEKRSQEISKLSKKMTIGKMRLEYFVREIEVKIIERLLMKKLQQRSVFFQAEHSEEVLMLSAKGITIESLTKEIQILKEDARKLVDINAQLLNEIFKAKTESFFFEPSIDPWL